MRDDNGDNSSNNGSWCIDIERVKVNGFKPNGCCLERYLCKKHTHRLEAYKEKSVYIVMYNSFSSNMFQSDNQKLELACNPYLRIGVTSENHKRCTNKLMQYINERYPLGMYIPINETLGGKVYRVNTFTARPTVGGSQAIINDNPVQFVQFLQEVSSKFKTAIYFSYEGEALVIKQDSIDNLNDPLLKYGIPFEKRGAFAKAMHYTEFLKIAELKTTNMMNNLTNEAEKFLQNLATTHRSVQ